MQTVGHKIEGANVLQIFAIDLETKERFEITDLYFFEEQGIMAIMRLRFLCVV